MIHCSSFDDSLLNLKSLLNDDLQIMEDFIINNSQSSQISLITEIVLHLIKSGGKRLRPIIVLIICRIFNYTEDNRIHIAAAIEFIHNATLLHDDVIDESEVRRGKNTSNSLWGNKSSILVGDFLLTMAFRWAIACKNLTVLSILSQSSYTIVSGEIKQMIASNDINLTEENYIEIISAKTASLFAAACESAAIISSASATEQKALQEFGTNLGISFQIIDDVLDYTSSTDTLGKKLGCDFYSGKITLPVIICYKNADEEEKKFWQQSTQKESSSIAKPTVKLQIQKEYTMEDHNIYTHKDLNIGTVRQFPEEVGSCKKSIDFQQALSYIKLHNAIEKSMEIAKYYNNQAKLNLSILPESNYKSALENLLDYMLDRRL